MIVAMVIGFFIVAPPILGGSTAGTWEERRGNEALARVEYDWESLGYEIRFHPAKSGKLGGTWPDRKEVNIYVRQEQSVPELAHIIAHELGHAVDMEMNTDADRRRYKEIRGINAQGWFVCSGCKDLERPVGDFAETFAMWALDDDRHDGEVPGVGKPTPDQLDAIAPMYTERG